MPKKPAVRPRAAAKVKAKAKAKPKAAPKKAARVRGLGRKKPAAAPGGLLTVAERYKKGEVVNSYEVNLLEYRKGDWLESLSSVYGGGPCSWAGKVQRTVVENGEAEIEVLLTGTQCEPLLKFATGQAVPVLRIHLCDPQCDQKRENSNLLHCNSLRKLKRPHGKPILESPTSCPT